MVLDAVYPNCPNRTRNLFQYTLTNKEFCEIICQPSTNTKSKQCLYLLTSYATLEAVCVDHIIVCVFAVERIPVIILKMRTEIDWKVFTAFYIVYLVYQGSP